jgi:hypothetical protein
MGYGPLGRDPCRFREKINDLILLKDFWINLIDYCIVAWFSPES